MLVFCDVVNNTAPQPIEIKRSRDVLPESDVQDRMLYIKKCFEDTVQTQRKFVALYEATVSHGGVVVQW